MTDDDAILAKLGALELVLMTICRMLPPHQVTGLHAAVEAARGTTLACQVSDDALESMFVSASLIVGPDPGLNVEGR